MNKSTLHNLHVAIIMDGNGRWAAARGLPRLAGHQRGAAVVEQTVEAATRLGLGTLTLYAFSSDNWRRPTAEIAGLMRLFRHALRQQTRRCVTNGVRLSVIGRRDRLPDDLQRVILRAEQETAEGARLHLRLAIDYSSREAILNAAREGEESLRRLGPDVDLLIRTSGEQRLSDFLLWECAYAELLFLARHWPDFTAADLEAALHWFRGRDRRFGGLTARSPAAQPA